MSPGGGGTSNNAADSGRRRMTSTAPNSCTTGKYGRRLGAQPHSLLPLGSGITQHEPVPMLVACSTSARPRPHQAEGVDYYSRRSLEAVHAEHFTCFVYRPRSPGLASHTCTLSVPSAPVLWRAGEDAWERRQGNAPYQEPKTQQEIVVRWQTKHQDRAVARCVLTRAEGVVMQKPGRVQGCLHAVQGLRYGCRSQHFNGRLSLLNSPCSSSHVTSLCTGL